ncbi:UNVERIFIED_CONTAM: RNA pseudouridine synthase 1 [Sesamum calycinum]|uniref:RNA pseudouridine synthase 1 n=1 Tax=Sesamum calycinum TaxID=2727403 RepID=A0AAW2P8H4_9LAMI
MVDQGMEPGVFMLFSDVGRTLTLPGGSFVRDMETLFEVLSVNGKGCFLKDMEKNSLLLRKNLKLRCDADKAEVVVRAHPRSGTTHQIRLHCQYLGIPIIYEGHELHAESLCFEHPVTYRPVCFDSGTSAFARNHIINVEEEAPKPLLLAMDDPSHPQSSNQFLHTQLMRL